MAEVRDPAAKADPVAEPAVPDPAPARRWSLRARLIALVLTVAALALVAVDVVIPLSVHATMMSAKRQTLVSVMENLKSMGSGWLSDQIGTISSQTSLGGELGWSAGFASGRSQVLQAIPSDPTANPAVDWTTSRTEPTVVGDVDQPHRYYLALGYRTKVVDPVRGDAVSLTVVAWIPLADVESTMRRLVILEIAISLGLLVLLGTVAGVVIRGELRPLEEMAHAADEIAAGDLSRRVAPGPVGTEVGRLGAAFNGMVDGVSALLAERAASERRLQQFVADASHELRTPVAAVRGYTDLYQAGALTDEAVDRAMQRMGFETQRMGALVEDLLTLTQTDAGIDMPTGTVDLIPLLAGVVDDAAVIDRSRTWRLAGTEQRAAVRGDELRLHQLFANLLANVRTHTPPGTTATVSVTGGPQSVVVTVADDGPGVAEEDLPRLFDRFFRVDPARSREQGGSGLGMSIVAAIVRMHRGSVVASATSGGGLTVTVTLPAAGEAVDIARADERAAG